MKEICSNCKLQKDQRWFHVVEGRRVCGACYNKLINAFKELISKPQPHWMNARVWVGDEQEGAHFVPRIFVDGASVEDINVALHLHPEVKAIYFGHQIDWNVVSEFYKNIHCIVEVDNPDEVDADLVGKITVILRVPNWVNFVKTIRTDRINITEVDEPTAIAHWTVWSGQKIYDTDKVIK